MLGRCSLEAGLDPLNSSEQKHECFSRPGLCAQSKAHDGKSGWACHGRKFPGVEKGGGCTVSHQSYFLPSICSSHHNNTLASFASNLFMKLGQNATSLTPVMIFISINRSY